MVPRQILQDHSLHEAATSLRTARQQARQLIDGLFDDTFSVSEDALTGAQRLREMAARAEALVQLLQPLRDAVHRAEWSYPHQIAELARYYRLETSPNGQLQAALRLIEAIIRELGCLAGSAIIAAAPSNNAGPFERFRGGISTGSWLDIVREAQRLNVLDGIPQLASLGFGKRSLGALLTQGISARNRFSHAHGMISETEAREWLADIEPILVEALEETVWLSTIDHLYVRSCQYVGDPLRLEVRGDLLNGAHPTWERRAVTVAEPIAPSRVVALLPSSARPMSLHPFVSVVACPRCKRDEAYVLDRVDGLRATSRSIRDHELEITL